MSRYVARFQGGTSNVCNSSNSMIVNGTDNTVNTSSSNSAILGSHNTVGAADSIVLGKYGASSDAGSIVISASDTSTTNFTSRGAHTFSMKLPGDLSTTGLTAPNVDGLASGLRASGTVQIASTPTVGATLVIGGSITFTAVAGARTSGADDFDQSSGVPATIAADLYAAINDAANSAFASYFASNLVGDTFTLTYRTPGTTGNSITLVSSEGSIVVSGATLSGGTTGSTYAGMYIQRNDDIAVSDTNYAALIEYGRYVDEDPSGTYESTLSWNYLPQTDASWTGLTTIDSSLGMIPTNVNAAIDILASGLSKTTTNTLIFETAASSGSTNGLVRYNTSATSMDGDEDFIIGTSNWNNTGVKGLAFATQKASLSIGEWTGANGTYANHGSYVLNLGYDNKAAADHCVSVGFQNSISATSPSAVALGRNLTIAGTSTGTIAIGGGAVANTLTNCVGSFFLSDNFASRTALSLTSKSYFNQMQYFSGFSRGTGAAGVDSSNAAAALSDTTTSDGAREIFRPMYLSGLATTVTGTTAAVYTIAASAIVAINSAYVVVKGATVKALFFVTDFLADSTSVLNSPTIYLQYDSSSTFSPSDLAISVNGSNEIIANFTNASAETVNVTMLFYLTDVFAS